MKIIALALWVILPVLISAQVSEDSWQLEADTLHQKDNKNFNRIDIARSLAKTKIRSDISAGVFIGTGSGNRVFTGTYIAPDFSVPVNGRLSLHTGLMITYFSGYQFANPSFENQNSNPSRNTTRSLVYINSAYKLNDRLTLSGTVYKDFSVLGGYQPSPEFIEGDYKGMIMGIDYQVGKNAVIRGQVEFSDSPYHSQFYFNSYPGTTFGNPVIFP